MKAIQRTKCDLEKGDFILQINSQINDVVDAVTEKLMEQYPKNASIRHLVWYRAHPEFSVLVVRAKNPATRSRLVEVMHKSMRRHVRAALAARAEQRLLAS